MHSLCCHWSMMEEPLCIRRLKQCSTEVLWDFVELSSFVGVAWHLEVFPALIFFVKCTVFGNKQLTEPSAWHLLFLSIPKAVRQKCEWEWIPNTSKPSWDITLKYHKQFADTETHTHEYMTCLSPTTTLLSLCWSLLNFLSQSLEFLLKPSRLIWHRSWEWWCRWEHSRQCQCKLHGQENVIHKRNLPSSARLICPSNWLITKNLEILFVHSVFWHD